MARKLAPDKWLFAATIGLALFGVVMVYSASAVLAQKENGSQFHYVIKQGIFTGIGLLVMLAAMQFDYNKLRDRRIVFGLLAVTIVLLVAVFAFPAVNGAQRWIKFKGFSIQPSEVSKFALALFLAYFLERRAGEEQRFWRTFVPCGFATALLAALIVIEPDFGTAMMLAVIFVVVIYTAGARVAHLAKERGWRVVNLDATVMLERPRLRRYVQEMRERLAQTLNVEPSCVSVKAKTNEGLGFIGRGEGLAVIAVVVLEAR